MGPQLLNCCRPENGHQRIWQNDEKNPDLSQKEESLSRGKELENRGRKEKSHEKGIQEAVKKIEMEGLMAQEGLWSLAKDKIMKERGELPNEEGDVVKE